MEQLIYILSGLAAAVWSVWTWSKDQQKERQIKRDQEAALYVNSTLIALGKFRVQLYRILKEDELAFYKKAYPDQYEFGSPAAIEFLYRFGQCLGWAHRTIRYGPYTRDPRVIEAIIKAGEILESRSKFPGDAFRFSYDERTSLGEAVVRRVSEATAFFLPVFESISLYQFEEELSDAQSRHAPLYQSKAVRSTLEALDRADRPEDLEGRERLTALHDLIAELLEYLESMEGFRVSTGDIPRLRPEGGHVSASEPVTAEIVHRTPGRIRVRIPRLKAEEDFANRLPSLLESMEHVTSVRVNVDAASVVICHSDDIGNAEFANMALKTIENELEQHVG
jgi:hypothetical protein